MRSFFLRISDIELNPPEDFPVLIYWACISWAPGYFPPTLLQPRREAIFSSILQTRTLRCWALRTCPVGGQQIHPGQSDLKPGVSLFSAVVTPVLKSFFNSSDSRPLFAPVPSGLVPCPQCLRVLICKVGMIPGLTHRVAVPVQWNNPLGMEPGTWGTFNRQRYYYHHYY